MKSSLSIIKKAILTVMIMVMALFCLNMVSPLNQVLAADSDTSWYDETATYEEGHVFELTTAAQLRGLSVLVAGGKKFEQYTIKLGNNIDLENENFTSIGTFNTNNVFSGTFDGNNKTISNLLLKSEYRTNQIRRVFVGLFGQVIGSTNNHAVIKNVILDNVTVEVNNSQSPGMPVGNSETYGVAALVGVANLADIEGCVVKNASIVFDNDKAGIIAGSLNGGKIYNCEVDSSTIKGENSQGIGLLVGSVNGNSEGNYIQNSVVKGKAIGGSTIGTIGVINDRIGSTVVKGIKVSKGTEISGSGNWVAGIAGKMFSGTISNCFNQASVESTGEYVAGITTVVGTDSKSFQVDCCMNTGEIKGADYVCGICVDAYTTGCESQVSNSMNLGKLITDDNAEHIDDLVYNTHNWAVLNCAYIAGLNSSTFVDFAFTEEQLKDRTAVDMLNKGIETPIWFQNVDYPDFAENMVAVTGITADDTVSVDIGKELALNASVTPADATNPALAYKSDDEETVTVTADGKVTGVKVGKANITITALYDGSQKVCEVTVKDPDVEAAQAVIDAMKAIDPSKATLEELKAVQDAYNALTDDQKKLVDANADAAAAKKAIDEKAEELKKASEQSQSATVAVKKGTKFTIKGYKYTVTSDLKKNPTVSVIGYKNKKLKKISISDTVKYKKVTFKVTEIGKNAFKSQKKATSATIGKNVTTIGASAFAGAGKLKKITVKATGLKKVGAKALKGINKKAVIKVPAKKLKAYKKLFKGKGQAKTVKVKK